MIGRILQTFLVSIVTATAPCAQDAVLAPIRAAEARGVRVGCVVRDVDAKRTWLRHRSAEAFVPASNQKLVTVAAFLHALGADYEFSTGFAVEGGVLRVEAGGDPNWLSGTAFDPRAMFAELARQLKERGVTSLRAIELDQGAFHGPARPPGWPADQFERSYCAPTGGLLLDAGCFRARVSPSTGAVARVEVVDPPGGLPLEGSIRMTSDRRKGSVWGLRHANGTVRAFGAYWTKGSAQTMEGAVTDPAAVFRRALEHELRSAGIAIGGDGQSRDAARFELTTPVHAGLAPILADSSNVHAEQFLRVLGAERLSDGSFAGGVRAARAAIAAFLGAPVPPAVVIADGSGLSRGNRMTPLFTVELLERIARSSFGPATIDALAHGGIDGTLEKRFQEPELLGRVRAKTGTIRKVSALSGFVSDRLGRLQVFAILMNVEDGKRVSTARMRDWQDAIVAAIHEHADGPQ